MASQINFLGLGFDDPTPPQKPSTNRSTKPKKPPAERTPFDSSDEEEPEVYTAEPDDDEEVHHSHPAKHHHLSMNEEEDDDDNDDEEHQNIHRRRQTFRKKSRRRSNNNDETNEDAEEDEPTIAEQKAAESMIDGDDGNDLNLHFTRMRLDGGADSDDDDSDNEASEEFDTSAWIEEQLSLREDEYTSEMTLRVFLGTWNVNAKKPEREPDLSSWILPQITRNTVDFFGDDAEGNNDNDDGACDIYIVGFQEIVDLSAANLIADHTASKPWQDKILLTLLKGTNKRYEVCATVQLVGLSLSVFVRDKFVSHIHDVRVGTVGTGIMGVGGNKGGCIVRFDVFKSSVVIVNSHLAAHQNRQHARNRDYHTIMRRALLTRSSITQKRRLYTNPTNKLRLMPNDVPPDAEVEDEVEEESATVASAQIPSPTSPTASSSSSYKNKFSAFASAAKAGFFSLKQNAQLMIREQMNAMDINGGNREEILKDGLRIYEHDHIWWIGDLNYRLNVTDMNDTDDLIRRKKWKHLRSVDQLIIEKKKENAFVGFKEGKIKFAPTYKYESGTNNYDRRDPKKARFPAWCDRIQWCSTAEDDVELLYYNRAELTCSDHKPVMGIFTVPMKKDKLKEKKKIHSYLQQLALDERKRVPQMAFTVNSIEFGDVKFELPIVRSVAMKNVGETVVRFTCESPGLSGRKRPLSPWLSVEPAEGVLHPGQVLHLTVNVFVDRKSAYLLNGDDSFQSFLVVRFTDRYRAEIALKGKYVKSCLGSDLHWLANRPTTVRGGDDGRHRSDKSGKIPFELVRLIEHIRSNGGTTTKKIFRPLSYSPSIGIETSKSIGSETPLMNKEEMFIIDCLDSGRPFAKLPLGHYIQALLYFLHSLHKPLFYKRQKSIAQMNSKEKEKYKKEREEAEQGLVGIRLGEWCVRARQSMSSENDLAFAYVLNFLREVVKNEDVNNMRAEFIAICVADCITQKPSEEPYSDEMPKTPVQIIEHLLTTNDF